jgi:hypothetical protein
VQFGQVGKVQLIVDRPAGNRTVVSSGAGVATSCLSGHRGLDCGRRGRIPRSARAPAIGIVMEKPRSTSCSPAGGADPIEIGCLGSRCGSLTECRERRVELVKYRRGNGIVFRHGRPSTGIGHLERRRLRDNGLRRLVVLQIVRALPASATPERD